jgi:hypothetical protein
MFRRNIKGEGRSTFTFTTTLVMLGVGYFLFFGSPFNPDHDGPLKPVVATFLSNETQNDNPTIDDWSNVTITESKIEVNKTNITIGEGKDLLSDIQDDGVLDLDILDI